YREGMRLTNNTALVDENSTAINGTTNRTREIRRIRFGSGDSLQDRVFEFDLDYIPYEINGQSETAYGQLIPMAMGGIAYGRATPEGNMTREEGRALYGTVLLYSVNFPEWSGSEIKHDPVFSTFLPEIESYTGPGPSRLLIIILTVSIGAVAFIVILISVIAVKKRKSKGAGVTRGFNARNKPGPSYPSDAMRQYKTPMTPPSHANVLGEERTRASTFKSAIQFIHSFFFQFENVDSLDPTGHSKHVDSTDIEVFTYSTSIIQLYLHYYNPNIGFNTWNFNNKIILNHDRHGSITKQDINEILNNDIIFTADKCQLVLFTGKGYIYKIQNIKGMDLYLLDIFVYPHPEYVLRFGLLSLEPIPPAYMQRISHLCQKLSIKLKNYMNSSIFKTSNLIYILFNLINNWLVPLENSKPHVRSSNDAVEFFFGLKNSPDMSAEDVEEIINDLKKLEREKASRVISNFRKDLQDQDGMD
ncbi:MAG: hypothetical protein ACTSXP_14325, partial [Promethearchaeota archaeon]